MSGTSTGALPDPDVLRQIGLALAAAGGPGWTSVSVVMFYEAPDVYEVQARSTRSAVRTGPAVDRRVVRAGVRWR